MDEMYSDEIKHDTEPDTNENDEKEILNVEKKKKKIHHLSMKKTVLLLIGALVLIGAMLASYFMFFKKDEKPEENVIVLYDTDISEVASVSVDNKVSNDLIVLTSFMNGTTQEWNIDGQKYDDVDQNKASYITQFCKHLETKYVLDYDESKLAEYGLDNPESIVDITYADGSTHRITVGKVYGSSEGAYILIDDVEQIYVVSVYVHDYFTFAMSDMLNLPTLSLTGLSAQTIYLIDNERNVTMLSYIPGPLSGTEAWYLLEPTVSETDSDNVDELFENIGNLALSAYYAEKVGDDLSVYGFDKPYLELQSYDSDSAILDHFVVGSMVEGTEDTYYCVLLRGEEETFEEATVYTVKADQVALIDYDAVDVASPYLVALNVYWLRNGTFYIDGQTYDLTIERTPKYDDDGNVLYDDDIESTDNTYFINGIQLDDKQFKTFYSKILFLSIEGITDNDTDKGEVLFSYSLDVVIPVTDNNTGTSYDKEATYEGTYYKISDTYAVFKNNESDNAVFTVRCRSIDSIKEAFNLLLEGKMPTA